MMAGQRAPRRDHQTLPRILVYHRQHLHRSAVGGSIHDEIPRPHVAWIGRLLGVGPRRAATRRPLAHGSHPQARLAPHVLDPFAINRPAFSAQELMNKPVAQPRVGHRQGDDPMRQPLRPIARALRLMVITRHRQSHQPARPPSRAQALLGDILDGSPFVRRAYHFLH